MLKLIPSWQLSHADTACMLVVTPRRQYFHANCHSTLTTSPGLTVLPGWLSLETDNSTRLTILQWLTFQADGGVFRADNSTKLDIFTLVLPISLKTTSRDNFPPFFSHRHFSFIFLLFSSFVTTPLPRSVTPPKDKHSHGGVRAWEIVFFVPLRVTSRKPTEHFLQDILPDSSPFLELKKGIISGPSSSFSVSYSCVPTSPSPFVSFSFISTYCFLFPL